MSDENIPTPRTDGAEFPVRGSGTPLPHDVVFSTFARTIERELVSAIADRDLYKRLSDERFAAIVEGAAVLKATRAELAEVKADHDSVRRQLAAVNRDLRVAQEACAGSRETLVNGIKNFRDRANKLEKELADAESREAHNLQIAIDEAKTNKERADRLEKVADGLAAKLRETIDGAEPYNGTCAADCEALAAYDAAKKEGK